MSGTRDNSGSISKNEKKTEDRHPDIRGQATINGVGYWVSGWLKENDRGKWYSLSFQPKDAPTEQRQTASRQPAQRPAADLNDDIPF